MDTFTVLVIIALLHEKEKKKKEKRRQDKNPAFGVNMITSQVLYRAAQGPLHEVVFP